MKTLFSNYTVEELCRLFGYSRQAYYQHLKHEHATRVQEDVIIKMVEKERRYQPRAGSRKLFDMLCPKLAMQGISMGRDAFIELLRENHLLVRRSRKRVTTTNSRHWMRKYPNLIKEFIPVEPHSLWVSDLTYIETGEGFMYLWLITDAYSRKIVGWSLEETMEAEGALRALDMALAQLPSQGYILIHHSDRGSQYCSDKYVRTLEAFGISISMTENGNPLENAIAERVNGILKNEWLDVYKPRTKAEAASCVSRAIKIYNTRRPHLSIGKLTPEQAHQRTGTLAKCWKNYWKRPLQMAHEQK